MGLLDGGNTGRSVPIAYPGANVNAFSLGLVPIPDNAVVGKAALVNISGDDSESRVMSCTLADLSGVNAAQVQQTGDPGGTVVESRPTALIEWGVGGVQASTEIDFLNGQTFTIVGSFLRVTGKNNIVPDSSGAGTHRWPMLGRNSILGAFCGLGATQKDSFNAKLTKYLDSPGNAGGIISVPNYASNFLFYYFDPLTLTPTLDLTVVSRGGLPLFNVTVNRNNQANQTPIELPGNAGSLQYTDPAFQNVIGQIVFGISI